jgi:hypothetical protein
MAMSMARERRPDGEEKTVQLSAVYARRALEIPVRAVTFACWPGRGIIRN